MGIEVTPEMVIALGKCTTSET
uniref:Protein odr-4-like protein n=1 Tax=Triatoma infestans TaxID=30076 RepID=A0A170YYG9_TRIIF